MGCPGIVPSSDRFEAGPVSVTGTMSAELLLLLDSLVTATQENVSDDRRGSACLIVKSDRL
jgi:hypothetical protein